MRYLLALLCAVLALAVPARADELRPAYIEWTESTPGVWQSLWKASAAARLGRDGAVIAPADCAARGEAEREIVETNIVTRQAYRCTGSLAGKQIGLAALDLSTTDALVRIQPLKGELITLRLTPDAPSARIPSPEDGAIDNVAWTYTVIGIEHIVFGYDHLLFVLALVLLLSGWKRIAITVTSFTLAHSITLIGATLGLMRLPSRPVEAVIALSIVFLALEVVKRDPDNPRLSERFPWVVAFLFGLLHGFGFAGALAEIGLPQGDVPLALLTFNLGVEIGQLAIVAVALALLWALRRFREPLLRPAILTGAYAIGGISTYWLIERLL